MQYPQCRSLVSFINLYMFLFLKKCFRQQYESIANALKQEEKRIV